MQQYPIFGNRPTDVDSICVRLGSVTDQASAAKAHISRVPDVLTGMNVMLTELEKLTGNLTKAVEEATAAANSASTRCDDAGAIADELSHVVLSPKYIVFDRKELERLPEVLTEFEALLMPMLDQMQQWGMTVPPLFWLYWHTLKDFIEQMDWE